MENGTAIGSGPKAARNIERLTNLLEVLQTVKADSEEKPGIFDMTVWRNDKGACGTAACAAGWYVLLRRDCGLRFVTVYSPWYHGAYGNYTIRAADDYSPNEHQFDDTLQLLADHFGLTVKESAWLFDYATYPNENRINVDEVISRVKHLLRAEPPDYEP